MKSSNKSNRKPSYDQSLCAYQSAFKAELKQIINNLPLKKVMSVLDVPCGNGFYSQLFADRLGPNGKIDGVDLCRSYLAAARKRLQKAICTWKLHEADAYKLPFADNTFDLVWCAQSLISLTDALSAVKEMKRVLRPNGILAVLENDIFHHVLLPWPVDLEVPILKAIQVASRSRFGSSMKLAPVRRLPQLFKNSGLHYCRKQTFAADRQSPWSVSVRRFLEFHVKDLDKLMFAYLSTKSRNAFLRFVDPQRPGSLFADKTLDLTCLNVLYEAQKPGES